MNTPHARPGKSRRELQEIYREMAGWMDRMSWMDRLLLGRYRRRLLTRASGRTLDVACGVGTNLPYLPDGTEYVGADLSPHMLRRALRRHGHGVRSGAFQAMDAERLAYPDASFDTVISSLSTCTFPDPGAALREMARVLRPQGRILLLEHGRSRVEPLARIQDRLAPRHFRKHGCRWNQEPVQVVEEAGLRIVRHQRGFLGVFTLLEVGGSNAASVQSGGSRTA